jgi:hypothetical protein
MKGWSNDGHRSAWFHRILIFDNVDSEIHYDNISNEVARYSTIPIMAFSPKVSYLVGWHRIDEAILSLSSAVFISFICDLGIKPLPITALLNSSYATSRDINSTIMAGQRVPNSSGFLQACPREQ